MAAYAATTTTTDACTVSILVSTTVLPSFAVYT
jgi:hypothetical protein